MKTQVTHITDNFSGGLSSLDGDCISWEEIALSNCGLKALSVKFLQGRTQMKTSVA